MWHQVIFDTAAYCFALGVRHYVHSPGSRNAPIAVSFARFTGIDKYIFPDERVAGFAALGMAQASGRPVALCCTSGTAVLNYGPAVAEAFYRQLPLIVFTADRPPYLVDQRDGQTIRQKGALYPHVKAVFQTPLVEDTIAATEYSNIIQKAITLSLQNPRGPVQINVPLEEPFYPPATEELKYSQVSPSVVRQPTVDLDLMPFIEELTGSKKILLLIGQHDPDAELQSAILAVSEKVPVIHAPLNNLSLHNSGITLVDWFLNNQPELQPDILITAGFSVLSKSLKNYLRQFKPKVHWHFDPAGVPVDTYQSQPHIVQENITQLLTLWPQRLTCINYLNNWKSKSLRTVSHVTGTLARLPYSELVVVNCILNVLPDNGTLHMGNSMPVRYLDLLPASLDNQDIYSNRGTSGIDGVTSTALGHALADRKRHHVLLTGDVGFFYDSNAFFNHHLDVPLTIFLLNNQGGGIFRLIEGPRNLPELDAYFETKHQLNAALLCQMHFIEYHVVKDLKTLENYLSTDWKTLPDRVRVIEVFTDPQMNESAFRLMREATA